MLSNETRPQRFENARKARPERSVPVRERQKPYLTPSLRSTAGMVRAISERSPRRVHSSA